MLGASHFCSVRGSRWDILIGSSLCLLTLLVPPTEVRAQGLSVSIESPEQYAEIGLSELVRGTVSDPSARPFVLLHPMSTDLWWVQRAPAPPNSDGEWATLCYFGTESQGIGDHFQIVALVPVGELEEGMVLQDLPEAQARSDVVTVRRVSRPNTPWWH